MATLNTEEIQEIISAIKKTVHENFIIDSPPIELIHNHLDRLKEYLTHFVYSEDLLSVVSDFIESTKNLPNNHFQNKLTLKSHIHRLEQAFLNFQQKLDCYAHLCFMQGLAFHHSDQES